MDIRPYENIATTLFALMVTVVVIYYLRARHRERMELISQQVPGEENGPEQLRISILGKGILALSLGLGLLTGMCLTSAYPSLPEVVLYMITVLICIGLGLLLYYLILHKAS